MPGGLPSPRPDQGFAPTGTPMAPGSSNVVRARQVIVSGAGQGVFVYNPTAGAGNLIASETGEDGFDSFGNATLPGTTSYLAGSTYSAVSLEGGSVTWFTAPGFGGPWTEIGSLIISLIGTDLVVNFSSISGAINVPQGAVSGFPLPQDGNSGTTWVSGERAFMNNSWIAPINALYAALQAANVI